MRRDSLFAARHWVEEFGPSGVAVVASTLWIAAPSRHGWWAGPVLAIAIVLLGLDYLQQAYWRDFWKSNALALSGQPQEVVGQEIVDHLTSFLELLATKPWVKSLKWCRTATWGLEDVESSALHLLAVAHAESRQFPEALRAIGRALELTPNLGILHLDEGIFHHQTGSWRAARSAVGRALELGGPRVSAHLATRGALLEATGYHREALSNFTEAVGARSASGWPGVLRCHLVLGQFEQAREALERLEETASELEKRWCRGLFAAIVESPSAAIPHFEQALQLTTNPTLLQISKSHLVETLIYAGEMERAQEILDDSPADGPLAELAALLSFKSECWQEAYDLAGGDIEKFQHRGYLREILGRSLLKLGRTEQGLEALREFLEFGQAIRPLELDLEARLQLAAKDLERASL